MANGDDREPSRQAVNVQNRTAIDTDLLPSMTRINGGPKLCSIPWLAIEPAKCVERGNPLKNDYLRSHVHDDLLNEWQRFTLPFSQAHAVSSLE